MPVAVSRGRYDRTQTKPQRRDDRRARLLTAAAELACCPASPINVGELVRRARVDRNSFYELFGDAARLHAALIDRALLRVPALPLEPAATPQERLRQWVRAWTRIAKEERALVLGCVGAGGGAALVETVANRIEEWSEHAARTGLIARPPEPLRLQLIAASVVYAAELAGTRKPGELASALVELVLRGMR